MKFQGMWYTVGKTDGQWFFRVWAKSGPVVRRGFNGWDETQTAAHQYIIKQVKG